MEACPWGLSRQGVRFGDNDTGDGASEVGSNVRTFGWSISAGMDIDKNLYPDLGRPDLN